MILRKISNKLRQQKGIGLLEVMLSLTLISFLIVMVSRYYITAKNTRRAAQSSDLADKLIAASMRWKLYNKSFTGITIENLVLRGYMPEGVFSDYSVWPFGGTVTLFSTGGGQPNFTLELTNAKICLQVRDHLMQHNIIDRISDTNDCIVKPYQVYFTLPSA